MARRSENMDTDDKPFVCTAPNCGQRFTNSDHLTVHQQKHQLSLNIGLRQGDSLVDQTPTPTRFLPKTSEEGVELFEGLPDSNPFDQDFKKAAALTTPPVSLPTSLSTSIPLPVISISPPAQTSNGIQNHSPRGNSKGQLNIDNKVRVKHTPVTNIKIIDSSSALAKKLHEGGAGSVTFVVNTQKNPSKINTTNTSAINIGSKRTATVFIAGQNNIPAIIIDQDQQQSSEGMPIVGVNADCSKQGPVRSAVPHPAIVTSRAFQNGTSDSNKVANAKQKLKEILQQNASTNSNVNSNTTAKAMTTSQYQNMNQSYPFSTCSTPSPSNSLKSDNSDMMLDDFDEDSKGAPIKRSRRSQDEMDPDERRRRFLERNRAAASRCRQKRKVWVQQLEKKADELSANNTTLQNEINILRTEVAQLKALLLAHKDCPVTMQQQNVILKQTNSGFSDQDNNMITMVSMNHHHQQTAEEVASSALTDMANQGQIVESRVSGEISVISGLNSQSMDNSL
eukprot:Seg4439.3 transcript_id=Seg4439.3/GoldUCD/mRNA.D3Y31 product="Cyclic AMP-dependent transcription factor ATF-2" protein_id=Seg4439.3/GoldUCD/D3Y31